MVSPVSKNIQNQSMVAARLFLMLLPALCCSWMAMNTTLSYNIQNQAAESHGNDRPLYTPSPIDGGASQRLAELLPTTIVQGIPLNRTDGCFYLNSREWLQGPRMGNANEDTSAETERLLQRLILDVPSVWTEKGSTSYLLQQSICHEDSRFLDVGEHQEQLWTVRLIYLALHTHQFLPALDEARTRYEGPNSCSDEQMSKHIGLLDYECPAAKFLVVSLAKSGLGSNIRLGAVPAFMAGLATGRVVLFVNNSPVGPKFLREPWPLASCDRRDAQCFFLPTSPCVLTQDELLNAHELQKQEMRHMFRHGKVPEEHENDRVLIVHLKFRPQRVPLNLRPALHNLSTSLLNHLAGTDQRLPMLQAAASRILQEDQPTTTNYAYIGIGSPVYHALVLYTLRPNPMYARQIDGILQEIVPSDHDPNHAVGMPIRASDKCDGESQCFAFAKYMRAIVGTVQTEYPSTSPKLADQQTSIVVTTESQEVLRELHEFAANETLRQGVPFPFRLITNHRDIAQNTGYLEHIADHPTIKADNAMLSAVSSLKAQLSNRVTVGNCCSNFHLLLSDILSEGCGAATEGKFQCLQDHKDPEFRICCAWDKSTECQARRNLTHTTK